VILRFCILRPPFTFLLFYLSTPSGTPLPSEGLGEVKALDRLARHRHWNLDSRG
jgi:hypothetical protein